MTLGAGRTVLLLIAVATALRLALAAVTDLGLDEAYALSVSRQFQLSWFDHPPMVFWIAGTMQALFGLGIAPLVLRLPFIALSAISTWLLFRLTERHFGDGAGLWAALLFTLAPFFFLSAGSWVVPDGPLIFSMLLAAWALGRIAKTEAPDARWRDWLIAGVALGLALLSKYHAIVFAAGVAAAFVLHPGLCRWSNRPQPYVAALVAALLFLPVLIWNAQNEWSSFAFQLGRSSHAPAAAELLRVFALEAIYLLPTTMLLLVAAIVWPVVSRRTSRASALFFLALGLPILVIVLAQRFTNEEAYPHWAMPGWAMLMPLAGATLAELHDRRRRTATVVAAVSLVQFAAVIAAVVLLFSAARLPNAEVDRFRLEAGSWDGLTAGLRENDALRDADFLVTLWWSDAARVAEALRVPQPALVFSSDARGTAWVADQRDFVGHDALIVTRARHTATMRDRLDGYFEHLEFVGSYPIEPGSPVMVEVTRGINLVKPYPLPRGPR
jgi:4-amino-4-deoxy-L-arabinose transferase-like glycosyltransferase